MRISDWSSDVCSSDLVSRVTDGSMWRDDYFAFAERVRRCANMLRDIGVRPGDRVTSLAWNTYHHMELFFAVPGIGAVLHTANPRLSDDQIAYTIEIGRASCRERVCQYV